MDYFKFKNKHHGVSVIETLIYLAIFAFISIAVINSFIVIMSSFSTIRTNHELINSGSVVMNRISYEIRQAKSIDLTNTTNTTLQLNSTDSSGNNIVIKFTQNNGALDFYKDGVLVGNLFAQNVVLNSIYFDRIATTSSEGVKIQMTIQNNHGALNKIENFYNTIMIRGGY